MIKKIILGSAFLFSLHTFAQEGTASPYSFYGLGETKFNGTIENKSMGGMSVINDSLRINLQNPADLTSLKLTGFAVGGSFVATKLKTDQDTEKAQRTTFDYLAMAFPVNSKMAFSLGLMPYSSVGYKIINITNDEGTRFNGVGNINKFFVGAGYQINKNFSIGADVSYNFGRTEKSALYLRSDIQYGTREQNIATINGLAFKTGLTYKAKINKYDFTTGLIFAPGSVLKSDNTRNIAKITYTSSGSEIVWEANDVEIPNSEIRLPSKFTLGSGFGLDKKWFVAAEATLLSKGNYGDNYAGAEYEKATKFAFGGYYIPKYNSFSSYFDRVSYRAGLRYENTGLVLKSESIKDRALTLGLGLPLYGSTLNVGMEVGKRGTTNAGLIQENYMGFSVGLSFNDRWFVKRRFD